VNRRADLISAWATGVGVGFIVFMLAWIVGARVTERIWAQPTAAIVAMSVAIAAGVIAAVLMGVRLRRSVHSEHRQLT